MVRVMGIVLRGVNFSYKNKEILKNANLEINNPGIYLIRGENGVGKSTLLNIISKLVKARGKVKNDFSNLGYVFQNSYLLSFLSARELFELFGVNIEMLKEFNLIDKLESYPFSLSSGERQRMAIIIGLYSGNELVILDEPFANLDKDNAMLIKEKIKEASKDKIILVVDHADFLKDDYQGLIEIKNKQISFRESQSGEVEVERRAKKCFKSKLLIKEIRAHFRDYLKVYLVLLMGCLLLGGFSFVNYKLSNLLNEDKGRDLNYNKFYLSDCKRLNQEGLVIRKCSNPSEEVMQDNKIDYKLNYDYLLNYLYGNENLAVIDNLDIELERGRYPSDYLEVVASSDYQLGDLIRIEGDRVIGDRRVDYYKEKIDLVVVGIYYDLHFLKDKSIYFDYDQVDRYFDSYELRNNEYSLKNYFVDLEIDNYKYLVFDRVKKDFYQGKTYDFYQELGVLLKKINDLIVYLSLFVMIAQVYNFYRINKGRLVVRQKDVAFLIANSFSLRKLILFMIIVDTLLASHLLVFGFFNKYLLVVGLMCWLVNFYQYLQVYKQNKMAILMREEIW